MSEAALKDKSINRGFLFISFGAFFIMLSLATHLPAYPHMIAEFNLTPGYAVWMQLGLAIGLTGFQPLLGWIGDSFGLKIVILIGGIFMVIGSLLVAFSFSFWVLVLGLFFKGISGAAIAPSGIAYAGKFMVGTQRAKAIGTFAAFITIGSVFGPIISGMIVDTANWQASFMFTAVLGGVGIALFAFVPHVKVPARKRAGCSRISFRHRFIIRSTDDSDIYQQLRYRIGYVDSIIASIRFGIDYLDLCREETKSTIA